MSRSKRNIPQNVSNKVTVPFYCFPTQVIDNILELSEIRHLNYNKFILI